MSDLIVSPALTNMPVPFAGMGPESVYAKTLPDGLHELVSEFQRQNQAPYETNLATVLSTLSVIYGAVVDVDGLRNDPIPLPIYSLVSSPTGSGKSSVMSSVMAQIYKFEEEIANQREKDAVKAQIDNQLWKEMVSELKKAFLKLNRAQTDERAIHDAENAYYRHLHNPQKPLSLFRVLVTEASLAGLRAVLSGNDQATFFANPDAGEIIKSILLKHANQFCSAWSGETLNIIKHNIELFAAEPRIGMLLMTQPSFFDGLLDDDHLFRTSGLAARFLIFEPDPVSSQNCLPLQGSTSKCIENWHSRIYSTLKKNRLLSVVGEGGHREVMRICQEGKDFLSMQSNFIRGQLDNDNPYFSQAQDFSLRIVEQACRIAALYELFNNPDSREVSYYSTKKAYDFMMAHYHSLLKVLNPERPKTSTIDKANKILVFLSRKCNLQWTMPNQVFAQNYKAMLLDDFQKRTPVRKKANYEDALTLLVDNHRILLEYAPIYKGIGVSTKKIIILLDDTPIPKNGSLPLINHCNW